jgi:cardiolipin synthase A/B
MAQAPSPLHSAVVEPTDGSAPVLAALGAARRTVDLAIYEISDAAVIGALVAAQRRGVAVRVLYNWYSFDATTQQDEVAPAIDQLTQAGISCRRAPPNFEVSHEKYFVFDASSALVMTFNLVAEYFVSTRDFGVATTVPTEVAEIESVFDADWNSQPITPAIDTLVWSPINSRARLASLIGSARTTLEVYNEELSDPGILGALVAAAQRGVTVRVIAAVFSSAGNPNANARGITYLTSHGVQAACKEFPVVTPSGSVPIYVHAKAIVADFGTPTARAFVGSENFSCVSLDDNRECGILVGEPAILGRIESTFESDWAQPSASVSPDPTALTACPPDAAARSVDRIASRRTR